LGVDGLSVARTLRVLSLNVGSSSLKFALFEIGATETRLADGAVERIGLGPRLWIRDGATRGRAEAAVEAADGGDAVHAVLEAIGARFPAPGAVGHRIVHGGPDHAAPERVGPSLLAALHRLIPFAPLHLPAEIAAIEAVAAHAPGLPQVVCFDTAFHRRMPELARRLPLPRALWDEGIRRYGFHGLSYEYVVAHLGAAARGRLVIAHLGNGASMAAVRDGEPVDTTMGFTPTGGLMMGTRSGDLDPGILLHLLAARGYDEPALERLVTQQAGLLGVSGRSADMETLLTERSANANVAQAVDMFCYRARTQIGALAAALGGIDGLVFTGGIGEHAAVVRWETCRGLEHLGIRLDTVRNERHADVISTPESPCTVRVVPTDEDLVIARHTRAVLSE
jgi:acetate kinase